MKKHQFNEKIREFTNQYSLTKTIRMELVPYNDDAKNLIHNYKSGCENGISKGKKFANNYVIVKKILDDQAIITITNGMADLIGAVDTLIERLGGMSGMLSTLGGIGINVFSK